MPAPNTAALPAAPAPIRTLALLAALTALLCTGLLACGREALPPQDPESVLIADFRAAHDSGDLTRLMGLVELSGAEPLNRELLEQALGENLAQPLRTLRIEALDPNHEISHEIEGRTYEPNLPPVGWLVVDYEDGPGSRYLVGRRGQTYRIAGLQPRSE
jgi:hypothetical protein